MITEEDDGLGMDVRTARSDQLRPRVALRYLQEPSLRKSMEGSGINVCKQGQAHTPTRGGLAKGSTVSTVTLVAPSQMRARTDGQTSG